MKFEIPDIPPFPGFPDIRPTLTPQQVERCVKAFEKLADAVYVFANKWHAR